MIGKAQLEQMKSVAITQVDRSALVDIRNIHIDGSNPYCFLFGDTPVRIRFVAEDRTLKQALYNYFAGLK